jgi:predicted HicB family RNase H-like nuclease
MMEYKGYQGEVEFDSQAGVFHGELINIRDVVTFEGRSVDELEQAFRESVDDYLAFCAARGETPDKPYSGKFVVRVSPELHRKLAVYARAEDKSLNRWVREVLEEAIHENS